MGTQRLDFAEFYREAKDDCLRTVLVSVGDQDTAQELVAEAFARAWASWRAVSRHPAPAAWVVRTALNANISRWRRHRRGMPLPDLTARGPSPCPGWLRHNRRVATDRELLRRTFDTQAERYDRARPRYPAELVAELAELARIGAGSRVLEVAPGTGQLTVPLARLGCAITAVELGPALAGVARRNLAPFPSAEVVVSAFEDWPLPTRPFDAVVCATALHWFDSAGWMAKVTAALRPGGAMATVATHHVAGGTPGFFPDSQACYERWDPDTRSRPSAYQLPDPAQIPQDSSDLDAAGWLRPATFRRYERDLDYTADAYIDTQLTYSNILAMEPAGRDGLLGCLASLIESRYGGRITKRYMFELRVARRAG